MKKLLVLAFALLLAPLAVHASDESDLLRARGTRLAEAGKCGEALPLFERALAVDPTEAKSGLLAGRCLLAEKRFADAEAKLVETQKRDPSLPGVGVELAAARYHQDNFAGARVALEAERARSAGGARFELYDGLVRFREGKRAEGIAALARARKADPKAVEPHASYYEGIARANEGDESEARAALERVRKADPTGRWGDAASARLGQRFLGRGRGYWLQGTVGVEYDDNVVLRGDGVDLPEEIDSEKDGRVVYGASTGIELLRTKNWNAGAMVNYSGASHFDESRFNYHYPIVSLWLDRSLSERLTAHLQGDFGYAWVDGDAWLRSHALTPALEYAWSADSYTRLYARVYSNDYLFPIEYSPSALNRVRDRDGHGETVGVQHALPIAALATELELGVDAGRFHAEGGEFDHRRAGTWVSTETELPWQLVLELDAGFSRRGYRHTSTFDTPPGEQRRDNTSQAGAGLSRPLTDWSSVAVRYRFTDNASSIDVFDYERSVVGTYLTVRLD